MPHALDTDRRTLAASVTDAIREDILSNALPPGCLLRQTELAQRYAVSRIPLREALRQLEAEGLVTNRPYRGAIVNPVSEEDVHEIMELRCALTQLAVRRTAASRTEADLDRLGELLEAIEREQTPQRWAILLTEFHGRLSATADRPRLTELLRSLHNLSRRYRVHIFASAALRALTHEQLRLLLASCREHDPEAAAGRVQAYHDALLRGYLAHRDVLRPSGPTPR